MALTVNSTGSLLITFFIKTAIHLLRPDASCASSFTGHPLSYQLKCQMTDSLENKNGVMMWLKRFVPKISCAIFALCIEFAVFSEDEPAEILPCNVAWSRSKFLISAHCLFTIRVRHGHHRVNTAQSQVCYITMSSTLLAVISDLYYPH